VCECVCLWVREREREKGREGGREGGRMQGNRETGTFLVSFAQFKQRIMYGESDRSNPSHFG